jgi:hypothetical protein
MKKPKSPRAPQNGGSHVPDHPNPKDPEHGEWLIDEGSDESFPASDPSEAVMPHPRPSRRKDH